MINNLLLLPLLLPLLTAVICLFCWNYVRVQQWICAASTIGVIAVSAILMQHVWHQEILVVQVGSWPAPFGITFMADLFSSGMLLLTSILGFCIFCYSLADLKPEHKAFGFYPLLQLLLVGLSGILLTGDVFNLFVWFELVLISCFVLLTLGGRRAQIEGAIKYMTINFLASCLLLAGCGYLYALTGTLNMADLSQRLPLVQNAGMVKVASFFFLTSLGIKSALFPLFFWLPATYHTPPVTISALMAGLITKVSMFALFRMCTLVFAMNMEFLQPLLIVVAALSMLVGVLGAAAQYNFRKILSFHIISQIGYMLMGLALYSPLAIAGAVFFIFHNIIVKTNLFLISGMVYHLQGSYKLKFLGGLYKSYPFIAALFAIAAFSLAGIPPTSGFWGKLLLARSALDAEQFLLVGISLFVSILTLFSMTKIWAEVFWKPQPEKVKLVPVTEKSFFRNKLPLWLPVILLSALTIVFGLFAEPVLQYCNRAALQLLDSSLYQNHVLD